VVGGKRSGDAIGTPERFATHRDTQSFNPVLAMADLVAKVEDTQLKRARLLGSQIVFFELGATKAEVVVVGAHVLVELAHRDFVKV